MRAALGHAEVGAFADHLGAELGRRDAQRVVGAVAGLRVALARGAHVGADAAEPQQVGLALEDRAHQVGRA